jgi:hypothetical protein
MSHDGVGQIDCAGYKFDALPIGELEILRRCMEADEAKRERRPAR